MNMMGIYANNATINTNQRYIDMYPYNPATKQYEVQYQMFDFTNMFSFFGTCGMCFSIGAIAPWIVGAMRKPGSFPKVSWVSYPIVATVYGIIVIVTFAAHWI